MTMYHVCGKINVFLLVAAICITVAFFLQLLGVALPNWLEIDQTTTKDQYWGLFEVCISITNHEHVCRSFSSANVSVDAWWDANAALQTIALIFIFTSLILQYITLIFCRRISLIYLLAAIFAFVAGLFIMIGLIVFGASFDQGGEDLHASFYLCLFGLAFGVVSGIFCLLARNLEFVY